MLFNSHVFIFAFLPVTLVIYFLLGGRGFHRMAGTWLSAASLFFYAWWNPLYLPLLLASIAGNYALGVFLNNSVAAGRRRSARWLLALGVTANLALLGYYKYGNFFLSTANDLAGTSFAINPVFLPLAISFFTFTQIAYLVDAYHGVTREYDFLYYLLFVSFFPHLIAGPIVLYRSLMPQFARVETYRFHAEHFAGGLTLFAFGLFKKVVFADGLAPVANSVFGSLGNGGTPDAATAWTGALAYTFQLYFDFSGYSDMAVGLGRMFNVRFPANFDSPYKAVDIIDFWRRWHITLSLFLRDHLYIPLGGNRKGPIRRYSNLFMTMLLGGLWHGAGWTFVIWGGLHGIYLMVNHAWNRMAGGRRWAVTPGAKVCGRTITFLAVVVGWVFFRAASVDDAVVMLRGMAGFGEGAGLAAIKGRDLLWLGLTAAIALFAPNTNELFRMAIPAKAVDVEPAPLWRLSRGHALLASVVFVAAILHLSRVSEFLYFQF